MSIPELVKELGNHFNVALALNHDGMARLQLDDELLIDFEHDEASSRLLVYAAIGMLPAGAEREALMLELLEANLFGSGTGSCAPAFDSAQSEFLLWFAAEEADSVAGLVPKLENLAIQAEKWRDRLRQPGVKASDSASLAQSAPGGFDFFLRA